MRSIKMSRNQFQICLFCLLLAFLVFPSNVFAQLGLNQERMSKADWSRGFHGFNMIVENHNLERISLRQFHVSNPADVLLIVIGRLDNLPLHVTNHVDNGGAVLLASDSQVPYRDRSFAGVRFGKLIVFPTKDSDAFRGMYDCPVVSNFKSHPILSNIGELVTNRPGFIWANRRSTLATLPTNYGRHHSDAFIAASENRIGGRAVAVADQSIFTNQMILFGDNAVFANQTLKWLKNDRAKKMLILVDGTELSSITPSDVTIEMPAPSRDEVMDTLANLPPSAMLDFANSVATVVEDENMVNDLIHDSMDKVSDRTFNRFTVFLMFGVACLTFVAAFLCQRKLQSETASEVAFKGAQHSEAELDAIQSHERQQAAHFLLDKFCMDLANRRFSDWPSFPTGLNVDDDRKSKNLFKSMTKMSVLYKSKPFSFWTRKKLADLENTVSDWRTYFNGRSAPIDAEKIRSHDLWSSDPLSNDF